MFVVSLIIFQIIIFGGLAFFLRHLLTRNVTDATSDLKVMIEDTTQKEEEIKKKLKESEEHHIAALKKTKEEVEDLKIKCKKEMEKERDEILDQAHKQSEELIVRANKACETIELELQKKINKRAVERAGELICKVLPQNVCQTMHAMWLKVLIADNINGLERLRVPEEVTKANILTAFELSKEQMAELTNKLKEKLHREIEMEQKVQADLIAGVVIYLGNLIFDGSFASKMMEVTHESVSAGED